MTNSKYHYRKIYGRSFDRLYNVTVRNSLIVGLESKQRDPALVALCTTAPIWLQDVTSLFNFATPHYTLLSNRLLGPEYEIDFHIDPDEIPLEREPEAQTAWNIVDIINYRVDIILRRLASSITSDDEYLTSQSESETDSDDN
jgi:hypothetical protein